MSYLVTALWIARIFIVYTLMVVFALCCSLHRFLKGRSLGQKFVFSVVLGNFFYIMLVLLWGLFHITSRYVLILSTLAIPAVLLYRNRQYIWQRYLEPVWIHLVRFLKRENSFRFTLRIFFRWAGRNLKKGMKAFFLAAGGICLNLFCLWDAARLSCIFFPLPTTLAPGLPILSYICIGLMKWITAIYSAMVSIHLVCMRFSIICMRYLIYRRRGLYCCLLRYRPSTFLQCCWFFSRRSADFGTHPI